MLFNNLLFINSPLEQFEINVVYPLFFFSSIDISITNSTIYVLFSFLFSFLFLFFSTKNLKLIPGRFQYLVEIIYIFIFDILIKQASIKSQNFFPLIFSIFFFVLTSNVMGLTPFAFTPTSQIILTFIIAFSLFLGITFLGILRQGVSFFNLFIPKGVPLAILPLMILIEVMSYCIRPISLSVRLFANMLAGHTLLHIIASFGVKLFFFNAFLAILPIFLLLAIIVLEIGIAFLQAYVFVILSCIYLNDALNSSH